MQPELTQAFLNALTKESDPVVDWRVIDDRNKAVPGRNLRGTLTEMLPTLQQYNQSNWGVFACINAFNGQGQTADCISHIRTHVVDLDNTLSSHASYQRAVQSNIPPHVAVQSSPDKFHLYWFVEHYTGSDFYTLQQRKFAQLYDGDKTIVDPTRVMRVPGFNHCKNEPVLVTCWGISSNPPYSSGQIQEHLANINVIEHISSRSPLGTEKMQAPSLEWATFALNLRDPNDLDRAEWLLSSAAFRQCAHNFADEQTLLKIWQEWCAKYKGNDVAENVKMWKTFEQGTSSGWSHFRRVTVIDAHFNNSGRANTPAPAPTVPKHETQTESEDLDNLGEILDTSGKKIWFRNCYFVVRFGEIFSPEGRFMNSTKFNGRYGGKQFCMSTAGSKVVNEPWQAALRATDWTIPKVDHIRFLPEKEPFEIVKDKLGRKGLNTYLPIKTDFCKGDVSLWLNHLQKILPDENDRHIFSSYMAHCVKYPGFKIPWAILLQSTYGIGKTAFIKVIQHALGNMYTYRPKAAELVASGSKFNAWMRSKLAIIVDEIKIDERRELIEILKPMITDAEIEVQAKGVDQEMEDNCANWIFFSNHKDAIPIRQNDRRYCIFYSALQTQKQLFQAGMNKDYFDKLWNWLDHGGGNQAVTHWLLNYPVERGSLDVRAPETSSYDEVIRIGRSPLEILLDDKIANGEYGFRNGYISYNMFFKAVESSKIRTPPEHVIKSVLESKQYQEVGFYTHILSNEDFSRPPLIYTNDPSLTVESYEFMQTSPTAS